MLSHLPRVAARARARAPALTLCIQSQSLLTPSPLSRSPPQSLPQPLRFSSPDAPGAFTAATALVATAASGWGLGRRYFAARAKAKATVAATDDVTDAAAVSAAATKEPKVRTTKAKTKKGKEAEAAAAPAAAAVETAAVDDATEAVTPIADVVVPAADVTASADAAAAAGTSTSKRKGKASKMQLLNQKMAIELANAGQHAAAAAAASGQTFNVNDNSAASADAAAASDANDVSATVDSSSTHVSDNMDIDVTNSPQVASLLSSISKGNNDTNSVANPSPSLNNNNTPPQYTVAPPNCTIVNDRESALKALTILTAPGMENRYHACDTETVGIDPRAQSPVGNGHAVCLSIYCGADVDFGNGSRLWVDNLDGAEGVLSLFKGYLEDPRYRKVWHNYSFDRHVLFNDGINVLGFGGDTMQMARLWNSARTVDGGYSLEALSRELLGPEFRKVSMTDRFSRPKVLKNGTIGKTVEKPTVLELQRGGDTRTEWIEYSVRDTEATWHLRERLEVELRRWPWAGGLTMFDFYLKYWLPFGEMLTDMEREGIYVRRADYLPVILANAERDKAKLEHQFIEWVSGIHPNGKYMNACSEQQKQHLFFAPRSEEEGDVHGSGLPLTRAFETLNTTGMIEPGKTKPKKNITFELSGLGLPVLARTPKGAPQCNIPVLKALAGEPEAKGGPKWGLAYEHFGGGEVGEAACHAMNALVKLAGVETMITTFIEPLAELADSNSRVHCSLGLNTETGRLSARRPNLQNQPALEKDKYRVRDAFAAAPGRKLVVADYGQLELRILAHITRCKSMIEAFKLGGDFHSRTAMGMYPEISAAVTAGDVLLEWDYAHGAPPKPLLKDKYSAERRKAKILNFSIAYGKTASGLAKDFGVTVKEAKATVDAWYADRPEVLEWQTRTIQEARRTGVTRTLMGRYRPLHGINDKKPTIRGHAERAAINTPIQGGAADVVMAGMLKLHAHARFRELGWKVLLQIHDELICEGPEESSDEAMEIVWHCMGTPFKNPLLVDLVVDGSAAYTWFEGK